MLTNDKIVYSNMARVFVAATALVALPLAAQAADGPGTASTSGMTIA